MTSSSPNKLEVVSDHLTAQALVVFERLLGEPPLELRRLHGGRNSQAYFLRTTDGPPLVGKLYHQSPSDPRDRLGTEYAALEFMSRQGFRQVPRPIALHREAQAGLYEYVEGEAVDSATVSDSDIDQACAFLIELRSRARGTDANAFPPASEAVFCLNDLLTNLAWRLERVQRSATESPLGRMLRAYLENEYLPLHRSFLDRGRSHLAACGGDATARLAQNQRTLSPSDFGFHNAVRRHGRLVFLDFEYFGWDDPVKLLADFTLHPGMQTPAAQRRRFLQRMLASEEDSDVQATRLGLYYPLLGLKWALILLNEFVTADAERRSFAAGRDAPIAACKLQLEKSRCMLYFARRGLWTDSLRAVEGQADKKSA